MLARSGALIFNELLILEACDIASNDILLGRLAGERSTATRLGPVPFLLDPESCGSIGDS